MVKVGTFFAMSFGAFLFWQTMDKVHVWIALHQDEKVFALIFLSFFFVRPFHLFFVYNSYNLMGTLFYGF
ncbi:hypothetical protein PHJA_000975900 [Phtheirospermum japonicum]|uniref:Cytochrome b n=1 Tax=Phtheirospermum japonicum TaxID=374723 RepID=A0A830BQJ8_9LAMI|nr:hypothetical protein PHJA_000975900 [Phtheirospermum japonicum]